MLTKLSVAEFNESVRKSGMTLVHFTMPGSPGCIALQPSLEQTNVAGEIEAFQVDVFENPELAVEFKIMTVPTLILFNDGEPLRSQEGYFTPDEFDEWI